MDLLTRIQGFINQKREVIKDGNNTIEIVDTGYEKTLKFNNIVYSRIRMGTLYTHQYWDFFIPISQLYYSPKILMIGLGGGTVPFQLNIALNGKFSMDIIEVNKIMAEAAKKFLPDNETTNVIIGDGADYLKNNKKEYDMIILDAFIDTNIPDQFFSSEFVKNAYASLKHNGILAINYLPQQSSESKLDEYVKKLGITFRVYKVSISQIALNSILICSKESDKDQILYDMRNKFHATKENQFILNEYESMEQLS